MDAFVKVSWQGSSDVWLASLVTTDGTGFERVPLTPGDHFEVEISTQRRCIGYHSGIGSREPCPTFAELDSGSQCGYCRDKDVYSDYVRGEQAPAVEAEYSVYLAQIGPEVKVGVTRSSSLMRRWIEQGADYAVEIESGLPASDALALEDRISSTGITQRIRKERKLESAGSCRLTDVLDDLGRQAEILDLSAYTVYPPIDCSTLRRSGRGVGALHAVKGQIMHIGDICLACSPGKVIHEPRQRGLDDF